MATNGNEEKRSLTLLWRIKNIGFLGNVDFENFVIVSPLFRPHTLESKSFQLCLCLTAKDECLNLCLQLVDHQLDFPIDCEWSFVGSNRLPLASGTVKNHMFNVSLNLPGCPTREEVFVTKRSTFLPHGDLTVQCCIRKSRDDLSNNEFISGLSLFEEMQDFFLWPVPGFSSLQLNQEVTTPVKFEFFKVSMDFKLKFSLKGSSLEDSDVNVELTPILIPTSIAVFMEVHLLENEQETITMSKLFPQNTGTTLMLPKFLSRKEILRNKSEWLPNDDLNLRCKFKAVNYVSTKSIEKKDLGFSNQEEGIWNDASTFLDASCQTSETSVGTLDVSPHREHPLAYLGGDFLNLYQEQRLTDFELRVGDVSFPVHKNILSARSPVFRAMFSSDMKESVSNSQDVPDLDVHTLNRMLTFLYGGIVESQLPWENAAKLYYAADKYQVQSLKQQCSSILRSNISVTNVSDILRLADRHQDEELTSFIHEFVLNNCDEVMGSEEWEKFLLTDSYLAGKATHQLCKKILLLKRP